MSSTIKYVDYKSLKICSAFCSPNGVQPNFSNRLKRVITTALGMSTGSTDISNSD